MSRTKRSHRRGCYGDKLWGVTLGWLKTWEAHRDGPDNCQPDRKFKKKYRRRARRMWKRIDESESRPVVKKTVELNWW